MKTVSLKEAIVTKIFGCLRFPEVSKKPALRNIVKVSGFLQGHPESLLRKVCLSNVKRLGQRGVLQKWRAFSGHQGQHKEVITVSSQSLEAEPKIRNLWLVEGMPSRKNQRGREVGKQEERERDEQNTDVVVGRATIRNRGHPVTFEFRINNK